MSHFAHVQTNSQSALIFKQTVSNFIRFLSWRDLLLNCLWIAIEFIYTICLLCRLSFSTRNVDSIMCALNNRANLCFYSGNRKIKSNNFFAKNHHHRNRKQEEEIRNFTWDVNDVKINRSILNANGTIYLEINSVCLERCAMISSCWDVFFFLPLFYYIVGRAVIKHNLKM